MAEELKKLRLARGQLKGIVTRIEGFTNDELKLSSATSEMLYARKERLITIYKEYESVQLDILSHDDDDNEDMALMEEKYYNIISKLNAAIKQNAGVQLTNTSSQSKLPHIDIPIFNGKDFTKFTPFMDLFMAVIHNNTSLSDVQRLFYLRKFLTEDALSVIINLPLVNDSYKEALELLKRRFDNKTRLISNHINIILDLPSIQKGTAASIRSFISGVQQELYALKNLQQPVDQWDMVLISILTKKLDQFTNRSYQLERNSEVLPTVTELITFLEKRAIALEESSNNTNCPSSSSEPKKYFSNKVANVVTKKAYFCPYCEGANHAIYGCPVFKTSAIEDRLKFIESKKLCQLCLRNHAGKCKFNFSCQICKAKHNTLLHKTAYVENVVNNHSQSSFGKVLLPTIKVKLLNNCGQAFYVKALLDCGSQACFATTPLVKRLGLIPISQACNIIGIGNKNNKIDKYVDITIHSPVNNVQLQVKCHVVDSITSKLPQQKFDISKINIPKDIRLSDDDFNVPCEISILLGAEIYFSILLSGQIKIKDGPLLQNTLFGYTIGGSIGKQNCNRETLVNNFAICDSNKLEDVMEQFWLSESIPEVTNNISKELKKAEHCFQESTRLVNNTFFVNMPLKAELNELQLGDSFSVALQRFLTLEKKFQGNKLYLEQYKQFIEEYIHLGHAKIVDIGAYDVQCGSVYFLAHHAVLNMDSVTTRLRVVFDGGMKSKAGVSLNDVMMNGPVVQGELFDILLLWRTFIYTLSCDITKMFRAIRLNSPQTTLQNILWRDNPNLPIRCLQLQTVTYGLKASTFLATRCLIELAHRFHKEYPLAAEALFKSTFVDDVISGSDEEEQLMELKNQLIQLLEKGSFVLHKWCSNKPGVLDDIPDEKKYFEKLDINKNNIIKTLGLKCDVLNDQLTFTCPSTDCTEIQTKRKVLSFIGRMFDPLGLIAPIIVIAKLQMQKLWSMNINWDSILPQEQLQSWISFLDNLNSMGTLTVPRCVNSHAKISAELVGYSDASMKAFGCCIYLRLLNADGTVTVNLLCSKSRVAPLNKNITIPRLELNSALLLAQVAHRVHNTLKGRFPLKVYLYSDSQITLAWIKSLEIKSNPYVSNRVSQIKDLTGDCMWSYVPTSRNPADLLSRGCDPRKLQSNKLWWYGPAELSNKNFKHLTPEVKFPIPSPEDVDINVNLCGVNEPVNADIDSIEFIDKYSDLGKLQRVISYVLRFCSNSLKNSKKQIGPLTPQELHNALLKVIACVQRKYFHKEIEAIKSNLPIKSSLASLFPFIDKNNVLRVGGRLQNAKNMSYEKTHPAILPKTSHLMTIIIRYEHARLLHAGARLVLGSLSQRYWLISGISQVKKVVNQCIPCAKMKAKAAQQLMGSLPQERLDAVRPFHVVGVDFCGPFHLKVSRIRKPIITKGYVALFVCFTTKAVHMELVSDLTTEAFLACLKRFIARRGMPVKIFCDNAKTFKGASNVLKELYELFKSTTHRDAVEGYCLPNYIQFKFIPSYAPEFGGLWEAGVKSFKHHFKRIVGNIALTFEGLYTVITEIEAILNSRPLLPISSDISSYDYLTPGHFLIGTAMTSYPDIDLSNKIINRLKFWNMLSKIKQDFWKVWSTDYLTQLQSRPKWKQVHANLKVGDLVIVRSDHTPPLTWPMARIAKVVNGPDGRVRVAEVRMNNKLYIRSFRKLCPLPIDN